MPARCGPTWDGYHGYGTTTPCDADGSAYDPLCQWRAHRHGSRNGASIRSLRLRALCRALPIYKMLRGSVIAMAGREQDEPSQHAMLRLRKRFAMKRPIMCLTAVLLLAACAQTPMGPTIPVMPGPNTSFSQFQNDQAVCRNFADQAVRDQAQGANLRGLGTAALTTALGAGLGAAIGGGQGAGIGAAAGALGGTALAARNTSNANASIQTQYDNAFASCMFSLGNSVPSMGPMINR